MNKLGKEYDLKKGVDFIGVTMVFYCHDGEGNIPLHKRSANCRDEHGRWDCGGGSMEFGEISFEAAVSREIEEEYGVTPRKIRQHAVENVIREHNGTKTHWVAVIFSAEVDRDKVIMGEPEKMDELGWFSPENLPEPLHSALRSHLRIVRQQGAPF
jgi:ADP-ribose pyrophosphatase YjhB (NUDIX family)